MQKYGFKKLDNIQGTITAKVLKQLVGLNEEDRMIVKALNREREERSKSDYEHLIRYF